MDEPLTSPDQPPKVLLPGVAVIVRVVPHGPLQFPLAVPPVPAVTVNVQCSRVKEARAVMRGRLTVTRSGFLAPLTLPDQPEKL